MYWLPKPCYHHLWLILPTWLTNPSLNYGPIFLVPLRLILLLMRSSLPDCSFILPNWLLMVIMNIIKNIADQILSFWPTKGLLSWNLQHFLCWVYVHLGTLSLQLIHGLYDSKLNCFSFLILIMVWMYYEQLTYCPHKYMRDQVSENPPSYAYTLSLSAHLYPASWQWTQHQKLMSLLETVSLKKNTPMWCLCISRNHFFSYETLCVKHGKYP